MEEQVTYNTSVRRHIGSSDAEMVARIARNKTLNDSDRQRIAVLLGLDDNRNASSAAMNYGKAIEDSIYEILRVPYPDAISNPYIQSDSLTRKCGFPVGDHPDYEIISPDALIFIETKATQKTLEETKEEYRYQLLWHTMMGVERAAILGVNKFILFLAHYHVESTDAPFDASRLQIAAVQSIGKANFGKSAPFKPFRDGLKIIADEIAAGFEWSKPEILVADNLPAEVNEQLAIIANDMLQIKQLEQKIDEFKTNVLSFMQSANTKSIRTDDLILTVVAGGEYTSIDCKALAAAHPKIAAKFQKTSRRKEHLLIKLAS
jgi:hypothetical protein